MARPVIGGNSTYPGSDFSPEQAQFDTGNVTDGQDAVGGDNDTGVVTEPS